MDLVINNQMKVDDVTILNNEWTFAVEEYERNKQTIAIGATAVPLDFWHVTAPTYIKLTASVPVNITMWWNTLNNVSTFEVKWEIWAITLDNSSSSEVSIIDFIITV